MCDALYKMRQYRRYVWYHSSLGKEWKREGGKKGRQREGRGGKEEVSVDKMQKYVYVCVCMSTEKKAMVQITT